MLHSAPATALLFEPFSQVKVSGARQVGTGLGLVICRQLIEMMGGALSLESDVGFGTRICIRLRVPFAEEKGPLVKASSAEAPKTALNVLVVDDHQPNRMLLCQQLVFIGHSVSEAENGLEALSKIESGSFDVVVTDCNMPLMDGYELVRSLRKREFDLGLPRCRVVGFTANAQEAERQRCLDVGMDDCLFKPVLLEALRECLNSLGAGHDSNNSAFLPSADVLDFDVLGSLIGSDHQTLRLLLTELQRSNELDLRQLDDELVVGRWHDIGQLVHRLKGAARMVGAKELIEAALKYEEGVGSGDEGVRQLAIDVRRALVSVQDAVSKWLTGQAP